MHKHDNLIPYDDDILLDQMADPEQEALSDKISQLPEEFIFEMIDHNMEEKCQDNIDTCKYCRINAGIFTDFPEIKSPFTDYP